MAKFKHTISVVVQTEDDGVVWEGRALAVSSVNSLGSFDILPQHANFITFIKNKPIDLKKEDGTKQTFALNQAVIYVHNDAVSIYGVGAKDKTRIDELS